MNVGTTMITPSELLVRHLIEAAECHIAAVDAGDEREIARTRGKLRGELIVYRTLSSLAEAHRLPEAAGDSILPADGLGAPLGAT